jgi:hypothetical protein
MWESEPLVLAEEAPEPVPVVTTSSVPEAVPGAAAPTVPDTDQSEPVEFAQEPGVDSQLLFILINEALQAWENQREDLEALWCQVGYYLFPETAPDETTLDVD